MPELYQTDVLIIGSGIAGAVAALELSQNNIDVLLITRASDPEESNTRYAQGGIIYRGTNGATEKLVKDILDAGAHYNNLEAVDILAAEGPGLVKSILIDKLKIPFDRKNDGELSRATEGAHSQARILHVADHTGRSIEKVLLQTVKKSRNIKILTGHTAIDLITPAHHSLDQRRIYDPNNCVGCYCIARNSGNVSRCLAKKVILATGGIGQVYLRTSNPEGARGDGLAMAYRAGARVINCEFIQFHPTTFYHPQSANFLISEAVRGEGARLVNEKGQPFMDQYSPEWKDLAPRDITARSIYSEMFKHDKNFMYLDLASYMKPELIRNRFPDIYKYCLSYKTDITTDLIPIVPAAHYFGGGIWTDMWGRTTIRNLYAIGEVACTGVHGANRIAGSSLLEGLVWAVRAAQDIRSVLAENTLPQESDYPKWNYTGESEPDQALIQQDIGSIQHIMWNYVGLVRTADRLERALNELNHLNAQVGQFYSKSRTTDDLIGLRNAVLAALLITRAASINRRSIGCHYRNN